MKQWIWKVVGYKPGIMVQQMRLVWSLILIVLLMIAAVTALQIISLLLGKV